MFGGGNVVTIDVGRALTALVSGVHRCGSPWSCALCAPVVRQHRAIEIDTALSAHLQRGGGAEFLTLTLRHHQGDTLASRLDPMARALRDVLNGDPWQRRKRALGFIGAIKAIEVTHGANGFHPHVHAALVFERPLTEIERRDLHAWLFDRWRALAERRGLGTLTRNGADLRAITTEGIGDYIAVIESAWSPGMELARSDAKKSSRTPFDLLRMLMTDGETLWRDLWLEYEAATFGKRAIVWSPGLRARLLGTENETSDVELAKSEGLDLAVLRGVLPVEVWNGHVRAGTDGRLLSELELAAGALIYIADRLGVDLPPLDLPKESDEWLASKRR